MFVYDAKGNVYQQLEKGGYQNIGLTVKDENHSVTLLMGKIVKKINDEVGRVSTIDEVIAKFHISSDNPLNLIATRSTKK